MVILINDASLNEQIRGLSKTNKTDVLIMADRVEQELNKFEHSVIIKDVSNDSVKLREWNDTLRF
ncbi:hypothetical protein [Anaeromicrobium sediminis]|uniref:Uncharacterized protein n=1 Tax=Anaeromicrobium sediminis TaxID=1478221 RepID=A0A267MNH5_9FIRM|nr:hypothetical protein [Anaeromicrobium sediminis]PAB61129.1 hypothetical protein CCE28_01500 [Anaeromicrobium sediminis]